MSIKLGSSFTWADGSQHVVQIDSRWLAIPLVAAQLSTQFLAQKSFHRYAVRVLYKFNRCGSFTESIFKQFKRNDFCVGACKIKSEASVFGFHAR
jgi:hypothetical protein